jgi:hypothetical protein
MALPDKKRFADAVAKRFGKAMGPTEDTSGADDDDADDDDGGGSSDTGNGSMFRSALKSGDNAALCEAIRRIANG